MTGLRRALALGLLMSVVPSTGALLLVRPAPASAAGAVYDQVGLTALVSGVRTSGLVGASGGLVTVDTGSAYIAGRLDASPSAQVLAAPYELGTLARTVAGQVNAGAGQTVLEVPDAEARFPGQSTDRLETVPPQSAGPLSLAGGSASALTTATRAAGTVTGAGYTVEGALAVGPSTSSLEMTAVTTTGTVRQTARTDVSRVEVAGVLVLEDVVARATLTAEGGAHTAVQSLAVGNARVGGQEVVIGNDGVRAVGTTVLPGQDLKDATDRANAQLVAAGITVQTVGGRAEHGARSASADTGGVQISLATADLAGGVAANQLMVVVGGVTLTELDTAVLPEVVLPGLVGPGLPAAPPVATTTTFVPGAPGSFGDPVTAAAPPPVAPQLAPADFLVTGRRLSAQTALLAFAGWQFISLATATLYAFVERRRRLLLAGRSA